MHVSLIIVIYSTLFLFSFSVFTFSYVVLRRIVLQRHEKKFRMRYQRIEKDILKAIENNKAEYSLKIAQKYKSHPNVLTHVLADYIDVIKGQGRDQLKIIFGHALKNKLLKALYSWRWTKRLRFVRLFIFFSNPSESHHIIRLLNDKPMIRLAAINALSRIPTLKTLSYIFQAFENDSDQNTRSYINILYSLGHKIEGLCREYLKKPLSSEKTALLIDLVGSIPLRSLYADILPLARHTEKEVRIAVARSLGRLLFPESFDILARLSEDESWEVQAQAIKSLANLQSSGALEILSNALFSPHWHVRYNAGHGLVQFGTQGTRRLKKMAKQNKDRFASDMAVMVLDKTVWMQEA